MPPRMRTRSAGRPAAESLGGGTGVRVGRGGRGRRPREGNDERVDDLNGQGNDQGMGANGGVEGVNGNVKGANGGAPDFSTIIAQQLQNLLPAMLAQCGELMKIDDERISGALTDEIVRNGSIKKAEKRGNLGEPSKDNNGRDDNKRTRTGNAFATTVNPVGRGNMGTWPKCTTYNSYRAPRGPCHICFNCNRPGHLVRDCRCVPRNVNPVNARTQLLGHVMSVVVPTMSDSKVLRVLGERPEEKARFLMGAKVCDKNQEEIVVVKDFPDVFLDDLSGLPPIWLLGQLKELQDKGKAFAKLLNKEILRHELGGEANSEALLNQNVCMGLLSSCLLQYFYLQKNKKSLESLPILNSLRVSDSKKVIVNDMVANMVQGYGKPHKGP
ncbi:putative reverse transcriptase domain-containing protein [Tanacetum coccineum]